MTGPGVQHANLIALRAAVESLVIHGEACGHRRLDSECGYCDDRAVAVSARRSLAALADTVSLGDYEAACRNLAKVEAERDALTHVIDEVRTELNALSPTSTHQEVSSAVNLALNVLEAAPTVSLALHDAEVKAQAIVEFQQRLVRMGNYPLHVGGLIAEMIDGYREQAK